MGNPEFFKDPDFVKVAEAHAVSPAQVAVSWLVQRGIATFPKSANVDRQKANITVSRDLFPSSKHARLMTRYSL